MNDIKFIVEVALYTLIGCLGSFFAGYFVRYFEEKHRAKMKRELLDELQQHKPTDSPE